MKIAFFDAKGYDKPGFDKYSENAGIKIKYFETKLSEDTVNLAQGYDGVCVFVNDTVNKTVIDRLYEYGIKFIALRCAGYNNVDIQYCYGKIHVFHVPAYSPYAVAEHAIAMLLTSIRRIHKAYIRTRDFNFSLQNLDGFDLHGKTVGVVGTGKIGQCFINICRGFGMNVLCFDKYPNEKLGVQYVSLDEIFEKCDIISLHCPLTDETKYMINKNSIEKMKKGIVIINTSRGALIDTDALIEGIKARKVGAACLDVYEEESDFFFRDFSGHIVEDDTLARLISMPNVIVTSHQAYLTKEALDNIAETTVTNIVTFTQKGTCENELCYHCGKIDNCKTKGISKCF
ncbi:MAG: 2-hydroxyacid dehydrogenase [Ruminococcaceae bacterium]|nr:2-hydroxyacid dehydrogenase [Oscillospiraceae bacterium]